PCSASVTGARGLNQSLAVSYSNNTNAVTSPASASIPDHTKPRGHTCSKTFSIAKASSTTTLTCPTSVPYDGSALTPCSASVTGEVGRASWRAGGYVNDANAGAATASAGFAEDANHTGSRDANNFTIATGISAI